MIRRFVALLVAAVVLVLAPASDYGDSVAWAAEVATGSDASMGDAPGLEGFWGTGSAGMDLLVNATGEELERYYQSFFDYPVSLLEWPEEVPQPRFAIAAVGAAAMYLLEVLAVVAGIYAIGVSLDYLWKIYGDYETTLRLEGKESLLQTWQDVLSAQWGDAISGMNDLYKDFKAYCKANVNGYATGDGSLALPGSGMVSVPGYNLGYGIYYSLPVFHMPDDILPALTAYSNVVLYTGDGNWVYGVASDSPVTMSFTYNNYYGYYIPMIVCDSTCVTVMGHTSSSSAHEIKDKESCSVSLPRGADIYSFYVAGNPLVTVDGTEVSCSEDDTAVIVPAKPWEDLQWNYYDLAQSVAVPANQAEADGILANVAAAENAAGVAKALEQTWEMGDAVTDEGEDTYPWIPSITGWLEGIKSGIDSIKEKVTAIPETLARILDGVLAIPGQIADFFTLDTAVVSAEFAALQDAFTAKFAGISLLADVFSKSYSFDMTVPVFTVPVPEPLRELFGGQTEVVIMDLRPHTELFLRLRGLLIAMFWVAFAKWLLDQFDVKFHVG